MSDLGEVDSTNPKKIFCQKILAGFNFISTYKPSEGHNNEYLKQLQVLELLILSEDSVEQPTEKLIKSLAMMNSKSPVPRGTQVDILSYSEQCKNI